MKIKIGIPNSKFETEAWLRRIQSRSPTRALRELGQNGVKNLSSLTPVDTGETASHWSYVVNRSLGGYQLYFKNDAHNESSANVALLLQYGHGNGKGGYVPPRDYINPALRPVFTTGVDRMLKEVLK